MSVQDCYAGGMAITILAPPFGQIIAPLSALPLYVTATVTPLKRVIVLVELPGQGRVELVHKGVGYPLEYLYDQSLLDTYTDPLSGGVGFAYTIRRRFGWPDGVVNVKVVAYDTSGGEALN